MLRSAVVLLLLVVVPLSGLELTFRVTGAVKCTLRTRNWINITLMEDDHESNDPVIDKRDYLMDWFMSGRLSLGGKMSDGLFHTHVEPYLIVSTNCTEDGTVIQKCLGLPEVTENSSIEIGLLSVPSFKPLQAFDCDRFFEIKNITLKR